MAPAILPSAGLLRRATRDPARRDLERSPGPFDEAALPHLHSVLAFALSLAGDRAVAEDLVQDTYLRAWRSFSTFAIGSDCRAWLFKICKNRFFDLCRRRRRRPRWEDLDSIQPTVEDPAWELRRDLARRLVGEAPDLEVLPEEVIEALGEIPEDFRVPILLCDLEEMPYREIARHLHIPLGTVRSRIARGRALLRRRLSSYAEANGFAIEDGGAAA
jgi:RNA polymerase sigma-70 factor (ECF subfamily)